MALYLYKETVDPGVGEFYRVHNKVDDDDTNYHINCPTSITDGEIETLITTQLESRGYDPADLSPITWEDVLW